MAGLRELRKDERRRNIIAAARAIFRERGFDDATTADVARKAGVGTGTLFRYAADKHELLLMVLNDELAEITDASIAGVDRRLSLVAQLVAFYRRRFEYWSSDLALARAATGQVYATNQPLHKPERARVELRQQRLVAAIGEIVSTYASRKGLALHDDPDVVASAIHYLYIGELRVWLGDRAPKVDAALARLRRLFGLALHGVFETAESPEARRRAR